MTKHCLRRLPAAVLLALPLLLAAHPLQEKHRLSDEQLQWQGYRANETLRFGHQRDGYVRTYRVTKVTSRMRADNSQYRSGYDPPLYEMVTVRVQRTDSAARPFEVLRLGTVKGDYKNDETSVKAFCAWENLYGGSLPLNEILDRALKQPDYQSEIVELPDGTRALLDYRAASLLPKAVLGPGTYEQVVHIKGFPKQVAPVMRKHMLHQLYYARARGVVAFATDSTDLWYRLP